MTNHQLSRQPYEHQLRGIELMSQGSFCNFAEMGTGKTLMCIGALNEINAKRVFIVCPNSLKYNWKEEFSYSSRPWQVHVLEGSGAQKEEQFDKIKRLDNGVPTAVITNYESLLKLTRTAQAWAPQVIIADEAHGIKNHRAQKTKALKSIQAQVKWALTGTPVLNNPLDLWSIVDWVKPGVLHENFYAFRSRYCMIYTGAGFPIIKGFMHLDELKRIVDRISYRVTKSECLDLPEKIWIERTVELSADEKRAYKQMAEDMIAEIQGEEVEASTALVKLLRLTQITSGFVSVEGEVFKAGQSKLKVLEELLEELEGQKVVIFAHFKEEIRMITEMCKKAGRKVCSLTADLSSEERQAQVKEFQECTLPAVMVTSVALGGVGINLTAASHCVYFSNNWSHGDRMQSQDRLHRIGQANKVSYYDLIVPGSVDAYIIKVLKNKASLSDRMTGDSIRKIAFDML